MAPTIAHDLNKQLCGISRFSLSKDALTIRRIHRPRAQRIVERADVVTLQRLAGQAHDITGSQVGIHYYSVDACQHKPITHAAHDRLQLLLLLRGLLVKLLVFSGHHA